MPVFFEKQNCILSRKEDGFKQNAEINLSNRQIPIAASLSAANLTRHELV